eukprot:3939302-Rhodomonas_salina.1
MPELDASQEDRLDGLLRAGRELVKHEKMALPASHWTGTTPKEKEAMDHICMLFDSFKTEYWYYKLAEVGLLSVRL